MARFPPTARESRTCRSRTSRRFPARFGRSRIIVAALRRRSGSRTSRTRRSRKFRAKTRTTSIRCGSATASISSPIATARRRCSCTIRRRTKSAGCSSRGRQDIKSASACGDAIVYDRFGTLHLFDLKTEKAKTIPCACRGRSPGRSSEVRKGRAQHSQCGIVADRLASRLRSPRRNPDRARREGRHPQPDEHARRGRTRSRPGRRTANRSPTFPTNPGEYELHVRPQHGNGEVKKFKLGDAPSFFYNPSLVARQQEDRLHRQAAQPLVHRSRHRQVHEG